jgi:hypothetical protein
VPLPRAHPLGLEQARIFSTGGVSGGQSPPPIFGEIEGATRMLGLGWHDGSV